MRYQFIRAERRNYNLGILCRVMEVSRRGYYDWQRREKQPVDKRRLENQRLKEQIIMFHCGSRCTYGYRRIHKDLMAAGQRANLKRVARIMKEEGLEGIRKGKFKPTTTDSDHCQPVAPNRVNQNFTMTQPNQSWAADISYIPTLQGWLYLAVVLDLFSRRVIGWAFSAHLHDDLAINALKMAIHNRHADLKCFRYQDGQCQLIHHSDRGSQYASHDFADQLQKHGLVPSMSRKGNCYDNAVVESFFATLKTEEVDRNLYQTHQQAITSIYAYIEGFYNRTRRHSALGYLSPIDFENRYQQNQQISRFSRCA